MRACPGIQGAKSPAAMGLERAHAEFLGQGEGLLVMICSRLALRRLALCRDLAEEAQGIRLVASFLVRTRDLQRTLSKGMRLLHAAGQQIRIPQGETTECLITDHFCSN